ncbi:MAG: YIP1 family protein [Candidatus Latescibacterota bacterium]
MSLFIDRMIRAAKLDPYLYEEVEADAEATGQAMGVVVLSSIATGVAMISVMGMSGLLLGTVMAIVGWFIWAWLAYFIGTTLLPEPQTEADLGQMLRTTGFSMAPGILKIAGIIPSVRSFAFFIISIWMLVAMVIAVRQTLDYTSTWRAVGVCLIGWILQAIVLMIVMRASMF